MGRYDCTDWLGNKFSSERAMCRHYNVHVTTYRNKLARGYSQQEALTMRHKKTKAEVDKCNTDHLGNKYKSMTAKCLHYGIGISCYRRRKENGWSEERALTQPSKNATSKRTDHLGICYKSIGDMCAKHNMLRSTYCDRITRGWTVGEALTVKPGSFEARQIDRRLCLQNRRIRMRKPYTRQDSYVDWQGNVFKSEHAMCEFHNVSVSTYRNRLEKGYSNKEALSGLREHGSVLIKEK